MANPIPRFFHTGVHLPQLIPLLFPSLPYAESILVLQQMMEKLQRVNQSLELMLTALEDAQSRLEKHLEHLKAIPDLDGEREWGLEDRWELLDANTRLFFLIPQVRANVSPPPASHTAHTSCSWLSHWCQHHSRPSFSSCSLLPAPSAFQQSPLSWSLLQQVGTSVGTVAGDAPPWEWGALSSPTLSFSHRALAAGIQLPWCRKDPANGSPGKGSVPAHLHPGEVGDG